MAGSCIARAALAVVVERTGFEAAVEAGVRSVERVSAPRDSKQEVVRKIAAAAFAVAAEAERKSLLVGRT